jgi:hypothetical protein
MKVYVNGEKAVAQARFGLHVTPAADIKGEAPSDWLDNNGKPKPIVVEFAFGAAEVAPNLGEYLVKNGYAYKSRLIEPVKRAFALAA